VKDEREAGGKADEGRAGFVCDVLPQADPTTVSETLRAAASQGDLKPEDRLKLTLPDNDEFAELYAAGLATGIDEDTLIAKSMGLNSPSQMSEIQLEYKERIKTKMRARVQVQRQKETLRPGYKEFENGKTYYERGMYPEALTAFTKALDEQGPFTKLGGEIQMWQALSYQACGREEEAKAVYLSVENSHPMPQLRKQAYELR